MSLINIYFNLFNNNRNNSLPLINIIKNKYGSKVNMINCYRTSKNCHSCGNTKENLGSSKIYKCDKCKIELDRDVNAAMNMYQGGITC